MIIFLNFFLIKTTHFINSDASENWDYHLQDPATPVAEGILFFHNDILFFLIIICVLIFWVLGRCIWIFEIQKHPIPQKFIHGTKLEMIWTITPTIVLMFIAVPSFALLYSMDEVIDPSLTIKAVGHQWYWSYEYSDDIYGIGDSECPISFDSYIIDDIVQENAKSKLNVLRLLEVDNRMYVPFETHIRLVITAADVLHSWSVPSLGIKLDACPGRLNQTAMFIKRIGLYYGQCSEICGINHGFMPIVVKAVSLKKYATWITMFLGKGQEILPTKVLPVKFNPDVSNVWSATYVEYLKQGCHNKKGLEL